MRITVWGINYAPELTGIAPYNTDLCEYLAAQGHEVSMVTGFPYYPNWEKRPADRRRLFSSEKVNHVDVYRCFQYVPKKPTVLKRIVHEASFVATSCLRQLFLKRPDVIVVVSPPLSLGPAAWLLSLIKRTRFHFHVQDIQPDAAICVGLLNEGPLTRLLFAMERFTYRRAESVSGITEGMLDLFSKKGVDPAKQLYFPNWTHNSAARKTATAPTSFRNHWNIPAEDFLVVYSGNLGKKQGLDIIVAASENIQRRNLGERLTIVIAGDGGEKAAIERALRKNDLPLRLLPLQPEELFHSMLAEADLALVTQQPNSGSLFFPSKVITLLTHGCPLLCVADEYSELHRAAISGGFGECVAPGQPAALADAILHLKEQPETLRNFANAGRKWVSRFSRDNVLARFNRFLHGERELSTPSPPTTPKARPRSCASVPSSPGAAR